MEEKLETAGNEALPDFIVLNLEAIEACYGAPEVESLSYDLEEEDFELVLYHISESGPWGSRQQGTWSEVDHD